MSGLSAPGAPVPPPLPGRLDRVNWQHVRVLLQAYRRMEIRGGAVAAAGGRRASQKGTLRRFFLIYGLYGLFIGFLALSSMPVYLYSIIALTYSAVMLGLLITSEAGTLFFNPDERDVLGHLPIAPRTYYTARCLNLVFYVGLLLLPLNFFPVLTGMFVRGSTWLFPLAHLLATFSLGLFVSGLVLIFYGILMKHVRKDSLQNVLTFVQVALTFLFIGSYQVLPRVMRDWQTWQAPEWLAFFPPAWFASLSEILQGKMTGAHLLLAAIAAASTAVALAYALRRFAGDYASTLQQMGEHAGGKTAAAHHTDGEALPTAIPLPVGVRRSGWFIPLAARLLLVRAPEQRAAFDLVLLSMARDHEIKRRLYPSLAWLFGMPFIGVLTGQANNPWEPRSGSYLFSYFIGFTAGTQALTTVELLLFSRSWEAAYIFHVTPLRRLDLFYGGVRKAVTAVILLPALFGSTVLLAVLWGRPDHAMLHMLPWLLIAMPLTLLPFMRRSYLPFSQPLRQSHQAATNTLVIFGSMMVLGLLAVTQHVSVYAGYYGYYVAAVTGVTLVLFWLARAVLQRRARRVLQED